MSTKRIGRYKSAFMSRIHLKLYPSLVQITIHFLSRCIFPLNPSCRQNVNERGEWKSWTQFNLARGSFGLGSPPPDGFKCTVVWEIEIKENRWTWSGFLCCLSFSKSLLIALSRRLYLLPYSELLNTTIRPLIKRGLSTSIFWFGSNINEPSIDHCFAPDQR